MHNPLLTVLSIKSPDVLRLIIPASHGMSTSATYHLIISMTRPMLLIAASILFVLALALFIFWLWENRPPIQVGSLAPGDFMNLLMAVLTIIGIFIALVSLYVAIAAYQKSVRDSQEQQKSLDDSRKQLQAVVDATTKQQEILGKNLESSKAQQELLNKNLDTSKAQLGLLEEQWKREQERQARKPKLEITFNSRSSKELHAKLPLPLVLQPNRTATLTFVVANIGNSPVLNPLISVFVGPPSVRVDRPGGVYETKSDHDRYQTKAITLSPKETAGSSYSFTVEVLVPAEIEAFKLLFRVHGDNLPHKDLDLTFRVIPHNN